LREIYLDNSATTKVSDSAAAKAVGMMKECYGNPSSLHTLGILAEREVGAARAAVAGAISASSEEIIFTSGGTEANNLALFGSAEARRRRGSRIVTSAIEHSSVLESAKQLENSGFEVVFLQPDRNGNIAEEQIAAAVDERTVLVSLMLVNNEVGSVLPLSAARAAIKRSNAPALLHCDAVQAFGKMPVSVKSIGCDLLTVTGHKVHAPKGVGALFVKKGVRILPRQFGGEQEKRIRPGTESTPLIAAFGQAVADFPDLDASLDNARKLWQYAKERLLTIDKLTINSPDDALPYILNFSTNSLRSEIMLHHLAAMGIYCSSGSACAKGEPSHVLKAMKLSRTAADTAIRVSFDYATTFEDIDLLVEAVKDGIAKRGKY
jgi:cysteine desulfurase